MKSFAKYILAETSDLIHIETREDNHSAAVGLVRQCMRNLDIISRDLEPAIYDTPDFVDAVKQLALRSRFAKIRILIFEPETIVHHRHRLIDLAIHLSSYIELRKGSSDDRDYNEALLVVDETGYLHRNSVERYEGEASFNDKRMSKYFLQGFEQMWETATPDPNFRRLSI